MPRLPKPASLELTLLPRQVPSVPGLGVGARTAPSEPAAAAQEQGRNEEPVLGNCTHLTSAVSLLCLWGPRMVEAQPGTLRAAGECHHVTQVDKFTPGQQPQLPPSHHSSASASGLHCQLQLGSGHLCWVHLAAWVPSPSLLTTGIQNIPTTTGMCFCHKCPLHGSLLCRTE